MIDRLTGREEIAFEPERSMAHDVLGMPTTQIDPISQMMEAACETAIRRAMNVSDVSPRRLLTAQETAIYLALSEREIYNMIANDELSAVRHGRRLMIDIRDLEQWVLTHKGL